MALPKLSMACYIERTSATAEDWHASCRGCQECPRHREGEPRPPRWPSAHQTGTPPHQAERIVDWGRDVGRSQ